MTSDPFDPFGKLEALARMMEQEERRRSLIDRMMEREERLRNLIDPPALRGVREAIEASQKYSLALERFHDTSAKALLQSAHELDTALEVQRLQHRVDYASKYAGHSALDITLAKAQLRAKSVFESIGDMIAPARLERFREAAEAAERYASALETS